MFIWKCGQFLTPKALNNIFRQIAPEKIIWLKNDKKVMKFLGKKLKINP